MLGANKMFINVFENNNFNYQVNRILSFGDVGCDRKEVISAMQNVIGTEDWYKAWLGIAENAEEELRYLHSMYYYRMAEFFLLPDNPEKEVMYKKMKSMFAKAYPDVKEEKVPYKNGYLPCVRISTPYAKQTLIVHGGFDSFIEEFYLLISELTALDINIILFEGDGQGGSLRQGIYFHEKWEQPVGAILDYYELDDIILMGISWGGYLALRAAAFESRIKHVICHGILYDGLDVQLGLIKQPAKLIMSTLLNFKLQKIINKFAYKKMQHDPLTKWGLSHGMYITNTKTPYDYFQSIKKHNLRGHLKHIDQDVLLLTGEKDHYIPHWQYNYLKNNLPNARVESRMFTEDEGGEQHCQVGNYEIAFQEITQWIKRL